MLSLDGGAFFDLLRQPHGFEGLLLVLIDAPAHDHAVADRVGQVFRAWYLDSIASDEMFPRRHDHVLCALGEDPGTVMDEMGHADPGLALRIYRQAMRRDEAERGRLRALVEGVEFRPIEADGADGGDRATLAADIEDGESP